MAEDEKGQSGVAPPLPAHNPITRDIANISVVGRANKGAVGDYVEIRHVLSQRRIKPGVEFEAYCPYCPDVYQRWVCEELIPDAFVEYISPSLRSKLGLEKSLYVMPLHSGGAYFHCTNCEEENGARLHVAGHPDRYRSEGRLEMYRAQDREGSE
ncbi:hypothetical protein G6L15_09510 [Agrobacterium rhizogenes]|uniref:hypothetical protein n=1 Tax=Rhizobium rhizogenes TaxID=359 RepID=UPI0015720123|nr:hypothetical protein [Rhizobium rhizogenes]NTG86375.1 hypothetical protein [Rhizobium rhizogenes]